MESPKQPNVQMLRAGRRQRPSGMASPQVICRESIAIGTFRSSPGSLRWSYTTGGAVASSPAVAGGTVYVCSNDDKVYALSAGS
jgi:hypothetical protein